MKETSRAVGSWDYVPPADRELPAEQQTTVRCRSLTQAERMMVWDTLSRDIRMPDGSVVTDIRSFRQARELCLACIESVENFPVGDPKPWPKDGTLAERESYLDRFPDAEILNIGVELRNRATVGQDIKNS